MKRVLVTGANGFVGSEVCRKLQERGYVVRATSRKVCTNGALMSKGSFEYIATGDLGADHIEGDFQKMFHDVDSIIHLAARVHIMNEHCLDPVQEFRRVNCAGTVQLAKQAAKYNVTKFVYVSTIKVNGEKTKGIPFRPDDIPCPSDHYSLSKFEAENCLVQIGDRTNMDVVIVRPPLIYGPGVKGNFFKLLKLVESGVPLPFALLNNKRNMVSLANITDLLIRCIEHPNATGQKILVCDSGGWSTSELTQRIAYHMKVPARIFPVPLYLLDMIGILTGQKSKIDRLKDSLEIDLDKTSRLLDWVPPQSQEEALKSTVEWYLAKRNV